MLNEREQKVSEQESLAGVAEQADARDLKSRDTRVSYRFDPGHRHHVGETVDEDTQIKFDKINIAE